MSAGWVTILAWWTAEIWLYMVQHEQAVRLVWRWWCGVEIGHLLSNCIDTSVDDYNTSCYKAGKGLVYKAVHRLERKM